VFWDSSALLPYLGPEPSSEAITSLLERDGSPTIWWATPVECVSALERRRREGALDRKLYNEARSRLSRILDEVAIVQPHSTLRLRAERLLATHPLRAAGALQLAAALVACDDKPQGQSFACLDARLRQAAEKEGFECIPG